MIDELLARGRHRAARRSMPSPSAAARAPSPACGWRRASPRGWRSAPACRWCRSRTCARWRSAAFDARRPAPTRVLVCNDARMQEVYWACFERAADGLAAPVGDGAGGPAGARVAAAAWADAHGAPASGAGFAAYPELRGIARRRALAGVRDDLLPRAAEIARLAAPEVTRGRASARRSRPFRSICATRSHAQMPADRPTSLN